MWSELFVHIGIILMPMFLYQVFAFKLVRRQLPQSDLVLGLYGGLTAILCELLPVTIAGLPADFKAIPIILAISYGRIRSAVIALALAISFRMLMAHQVVGGLLAVVAILAYAMPSMVVARKFYRYSAQKRIGLTVGLNVLAFLIQLTVLVANLAVKGQSPWLVLQDYLGFLFAVALLQTGITWFSALVLETILESQQIRTNLVQSEKALQNAQRIAKLGSWDWNVKRNRMVYSENLYNILEMDAFHLGRTYERFLARVYQDDQDRVDSWVQKQLQDHVNSPDRLEFRFVTGKESMKWILVRGRVMFDEEGQPYHFAGTMQDVTEQKVIENLLKESEQRYKSLVKYNPMGIGAFDAEGKFLFVNASYEQITGYTAEELIGQSRLKLWLQENYEQAETLIASALRGEIKEEVELTLRHKDGHLITLTATNVPTIINDHIVGYFTIIRDLTEVKMAEELMRKSEKLSAVGQLAAGVAHEIRNPLTAIKGFLQLLQRDVPAQNTHYLDVIMNELTRIELISSELLILAKPQVEEFKPHCLAEIVDHVVVLLNTQAIMHNVELLQEIEPNLPDVLCEANQIKQVFINGIKNAIDALPDGGRVVVRLKSSGDEVVARIEDNGVGISDETLRRLGEPFYTTKGNGTGLGLMVTHKIIERHGGTIRYDSEVGKGTTVTITFPTRRPSLELKSPDSRLA